MRETAGEAAEEVPREVQIGAEAVQRRVAKAGDRTRRVAEQQPLLVAAGALAVGVALGMAINSRRS
jgi:transposase